MGEPVEAGAFVELGDQVVGGGQQDGVAAGGAVGGPRCVGHVGGGGIGADMDTVVVDVEADSGGVTGADGQAGGGFGFPGFGVGEAHDGAQGDGVVALGQVAQDAAGGDGGQLLVIADQAHAGPARQRVGDEGVEVGGGGHAGFVDDEQGVRTDAVEPCSGGVIGGGGGAVVGVGELDEFGDGVGGGGEVLGQDFGRAGGGGQADDGAATVAPGGRQGGHGGGFAGAGGGERELEAGTGSGHVAHQGGLSLVELQAVVGVGFGQG